MIVVGRDKIKFVGIVFVLTIIYLLRIYNLDVDLPPWGIINYQPMDEGQYATMALEKYNYGSMRMDLSPEEISFMTSAHMRNNIVGNILIYFGLAIFGDTYYGIRLPSVFSGLICLFLFLYLAKKIIKDNRYIALCGILLTFDFATMMLCRVVETTVYREMFVLLTLAIVANLDNDNRIISNVKIFIAGCVAIISVFCVYITNVFLPLSMFLFLCIKYRRNICELLEKLSFYIAGCGGAYLLCDLYYAVVWKSSCLLNTLKIVRDFGGTNGYKGVISISSLLKIIMNIFSTNLALYNICIAFLLLRILPDIIRRKNKNSNIIFMLCIFFVYLIQTLFCEDYIVRKFTMMYPIILILICDFFCHKDMEDSGNRKLFDFIYNIIIILILGIIIIYRLYLIDNKTNLDFPKVDEYIIILQIILLFMFVLLDMFVIKKYKKSNFLIFAVIISLIVNSYFCIKYIWKYDSYTEKNTMIEIGETVGNDYVYGIFSIGFSLYNDIKPVVNTYDKMSSDINHLDIKWYLDYENYSFPSELIQKTNKNIIEKYTYYRNFSTFGEKKGISIYTIE